MRILSVVMRYGVEVFGGAEQFSRKMATRLAQRGHHVEVATSCATGYYDWADVYEPGVEELEGVQVHRFPVEHLRNWDTFGPLNGRILTGWQPVPLYLQQHWAAEQGPLLRGFQQWLWDNATNYDLVIFNAYLYWPTWAGLPLTSGRVPTVLHPLAHDEPTLRLPVFDMTYRLPTGFAFLTPEEELLVRDRAPISQPTAVTGIGMDLDIEGNGQRFRTQYQLANRPYIACVGRIDPHKGSQELLDFFIAYKKRNPSDLTLVMVGEPVTPLEAHPDVVVTGFVTDEVKDDALAGCTIFVQPSYFESFSMVLTEAWAQHKPALVNGYSEVLKGQARRSCGAIPYEGFAEFEAALDMLLEDVSLQSTLGASGRKYVQENYAWDAVMDKYEEFLLTVPKH